MHHALSDLGLPALCSLKTVRVGLVVEHGLVNAFLSGLDERAVLDDLLVQGLTGHKDCPSRLV